MAVALGADAFLPQLSRLLDTRAVGWAQLILGVALFFWSFRLDRKDGSASGNGRMRIRPGSTIVWLSVTR